MTRRDWIAGVAGVVLLAATVAGCVPSEPRAGYQCGSTLDPTPSTDGLPGFATEILGRNHVRDPNTVIKYKFCPPTSGDHFNITNRGPIRPGIYPADEEQVPGGWLHNMEHGYVVVLYRCPTGVIGEGDCITEAESAELQAFYEEVPNSGNPSCPTKLVVARFDSMTTRFALIAWGRALLTGEFDADVALPFFQQWLDGDGAPEAGVC